MSKGRHGIKMLGLSLLAALSVMAVTAAAAQAGEYKINGSTLTTLGLASESITGTGAAGKLLVPGVLEIECTDAEVKSATILLANTASQIAAHAELLFLGCIVVGNKFCKVYESEADMLANKNPGNIVAKGLGKLVLMGTSPNVKHYLLIEQNGATPFSTIWFSSAEAGCTIELSSTVTGNTVAELPDALTSQVEHSLVPLTQAQIEALFPTDLLSYGTHRAWIDGGSAKVKLSGANVGKPWTAE